MKLRRAKMVPFLGPSCIVYFKIRGILSVHRSEAGTFYGNVCASVRYTRDPRLNGSRYGNMLCIIRQENVFSFLKPDFAIRNLWA